MAKLGHWSVRVLQAKIRKYTYFKVSRSGESQNSSQLLDSSADSVKRISFKNTRLT